MKKFIISKCMNHIKKNTNYNKKKLNEIEYGLVSVYMTITKFIFISLVAIIFGIFKEMFIFTLFFNIIRMPAFGLHATKSWICWIVTTILFIAIPILCIELSINTYLKIIICFLSIIFMYKNAPADTYKRPIISKKRREMYKIISTIIAIMFSFFSIFINNQFISNSLLFALILENCFISPLVYKMFKLPYNNYITYLNNHPEFQE